MATWNGIPFERFQSYKEQHRIDDTAAIIALDNKLSAKSRFAYYLNKTGDMLTPYKEKKLPNSLAYRLHPSMWENGYHDAKCLMFFKRELVPSELDCEAHSLQEEDVQTFPVQEKEQSEPPKPCPKKEHKPVSIEKAAQILNCSGSTIKRYDKGEGTLAGLYPGRNDIITLQQFAATLRAHKAQNREVRAIRNAQRGYDIDEL